MGLKDKLINQSQLEREARARQEAQERARGMVHKLVEAMQALCHIVANDFLGEYEKERLATVRPLTMKLENPALKGVFFPFLTIFARNVEVTLKPVGPVFGIAFRADLSNETSTYALLWDGAGNQIENWKIAPVDDDVLKREQSVPLTKERFEEAFEKLLGF